MLANDDDPDGDRLEIVDVTQPDGGTVEITDDGHIRFTSDPGFTGHTRFEYTISDGNGGTDTAEVVINVEEKNDSPVTEDDRYQIDQDESTHIDRDKGVLDNDEDPDGDNMTASVDEQPDHGHVDMSENGAFTYTPDPGFHSGDNFTYWAKDGHGNRTKGRVRIHVSKVEVKDEPGAAFAGSGGVSTSEASGGGVVVDEAEGGTNDSLIATAAPIAVPEERALADPASDEDGDGLNFELERKAYGTDPWLWDTDGDGFGDAEEIAAGTNPLVAEEQATAPVADAPLEPAADQSAATTSQGGAAAAMPDRNCDAYPDWLSAQRAYEAAGRTAAHPTLVDAFDPDWDGIACEERMQP